MYRQHRNNHTKTPNSSDWLAVPDDMVQVHVTHEPRREALVGTLERESSLVHFFLENLHTQNKVIVLTRVTYSTSLCERVLSRF